MLRPGNDTDFQAIEDDILGLNQRFRIVSVGYGPWQSPQLAQRLRAQDVEMVEFRSTTANFSPAIIELGAAMRSGRLQHDGNRCWSGASATWSASPIAGATFTRPRHDRSRRSTRPWRSLWRSGGRWSSPSSSPASSSGRSCGRRERGAKVSQPSTFCCTHLQQCAHALQHQILITIRYERMQAGGENAHAVVLEGVHKFRPCSSVSHFA